MQTEIRDLLAHAVSYGIFGKQQFVTKDDEKHFSQRRFRQPSTRWTLLRCIFLAGRLLPRRPGAAPPRSVPAILTRLREALCLSSLRSSSSYPHRRGRGRRRPHSCTAFAVATRHFSRFRFARRRRFRRWPDSVRVCDMLMGQGVVAPHAS